MTVRMRTILRWVAYPAFYTLSLFVFLYMTFPFERVKERLVAEFNSKQTDGSRLEVDDMSWYWVSGVEASGVRVTFPPPHDPDGASARKPRVITFDKVHARLSILHLLVGGMDVSFGADALGGHVSGEVSDSDTERDIHVQLEDVDVGMLPMFRDAVGLPMTGALSGSVDLTVTDEKLAKTSGQIDLTLAHLTVGDGKAKIHDTIALPKLDAGQLELKADIKNGRVDVSRFTAKGPDVEVVSDGKIQLRDPLTASLVELGLRFRFSDKYKNKNDTTRSIFGEPNSTIPGIFDLDPKTKRAKRPDGFYSWRVNGPIQNLLFEPAPAGGGTLPLPGAGRTMRGFPQLR